MSTGKMQIIYERGLFRDEIEEIFFNIYPFYRNVKIMLVKKVS